MKFHDNRSRRVRFRGIVHSHHEATDAVSRPGDIALVRRDVLRSAVIVCPDGCGDVLTLNLDPRTGKAWRMYDSRKGVTLFPSVWRQTGCRSHFVLWDNIFYWMDDFDFEFPESKQATRLQNRVWAALKPELMTPYIEVADTLNEVPWVVLSACRSLVEAKRAVEGQGVEENSFRRA